MVRRARTVVGNTDRLHRMLERVVKGECVRIVVFGGSVTHGYNIGGPPFSWASTLQRWLNAEHPCARSLVPGTEAGHLVIKQAIGGINSQAAVDHFYNNVLGLDPVDMLVVEFAVNDGFLGDANHLDIKDDYVFKQQWYTEILIRKCLRHRTLGGTRAAALMYVEAGFKGKNFLQRKDYGRTTDEIAFDISAWSHWPVLQYYQIPTVSFTDVIVPMMLQMRECHEPLDKKWGCYPINPFWQDPEFGFMHVHRDVCCHPARQSHMLIAMLVAFNLDTEIALLGSPDAPRHADPDWRFEHDASMDGDGTPEQTTLPALLKATEAHDQLYVLDRPVVMIDFGNLLAPPAATAFTSPGGEWELAVDSQDKLGLISLTPWSHVAIVLPWAGGKGISHARFTIGYLKTWKNISAVGYWVDASPGLPAAGQADGRAGVGVGGGAGKPRARCDPAFAGGLEKVDAFNSKYESVYDAVHFTHEVGKPGREAPGTLYLHLCLLPYVFSAINDRTDFSDKGKEIGKFKLLSVIMYAQDAQDAGGDLTVEDRFRPHP